MLHLQINPHSGVPVYRQMMDQIKYYVASGALKAGARLPSIRALAARLAINPATVVKAYTELQHEALVQMKQGKGAFVTGSTGRLSRAERKKALCPLARQLAVEASQVGASRELVIDIVNMELERIEHD